MATKICVFDVNGTLTNQSALDPLFEVHFGSRETRQIWFKTTLHLATTLTLEARYEEFAVIGEAAFQALCEERKIQTDLKSQLRRALETLPLHPDVRPSFRYLKDHGYRIAALSNSSVKATRALLDKGGVLPLVDAVYSTDSAKAFKPDSRAYRFAAKELHAPLESLWMIAAHAWDTDGAARVGMKTALLQRPGYGKTSIHKTPEIEAADLTELVRRVCARDESLHSSSTSAQISARDSLH